MNEFDCLLEACQRLENSLNNVVLGAVSTSPVEIAENSIDKWNHKIPQKLNDLKLLNSRAILLKASLLKSQIQVPEELSIDQAEIRLNNANAGHSRWSHALKMMALSRTYNLINGDQGNADKKIVLDQLLAKLEELNIILKALNSKEESKLHELSEIKNKWTDTAQQWVKKKKDPGTKIRSKASDNDANKDLSSRFLRLLSKMETMKALQGRLLGSCSSYDWLQDSDKIEKYFASARRPPYKNIDFL